MEGDTREQAAPLLLNLFNYFPPSRQGLYTAVTAAWKMINSNIIIIIIIFLNGSHAREKPIGTVTVGLG